MYVNATSSLAAGGIIIIFQAVIKEIKYIPAAIIKTLWDAMLEMYEKYGYYKEGLATLTLKGGKGAEEIKARMEKMRRPGFAALKRLFWSSKEIRGEDGFI